MSSEQHSGPLSDADLYALKEWIAETAVSFLLCGIYATFSLITIYFLLTRSVNNKAQLMLLAVIIFMFMNCTSLVILDLKFILVQIPLGEFNPPDPATTGKLLGNIKISVNFLGRINITAIFLTGFNDSTSLSFQVFISSTLPFLSALYPVLIILLVALENSKDKITNDFTLSQSLRFVQQPATTETSIVESESPGDSHVNMEIYDQAKESV
ncbi:hypothetical protein BDP27DRAFT_1415389 [Rhodocollybia butyracea]|uniref:Uncharacterized protein n=1 Tax=Rhodocollybia butyracea TaxID=206335 RepID=A0A9P5UDX2_9AGAR|nr:hypothetical protein BDP27DRAFT_1415389 [Rhodocollybia butyracea]